MFGRSFYIALGNLIYSVYYGDMIYQNASTAGLFKAIKQYIIPNEEINDEFGTNNSFYCIFEIERLIDQNADPYFCFSAFESYYQKNHKVFNRRINMEINNLMQYLKHLAPPNHPHSFVNKFETMKKNIDLQTSAG
ncbi:MAG: hypothetical protein R6T91_06995 [Bacteroidales bacterium]